MSERIITAAEVAKLEEVEKKATPPPWCHHALYWILRYADKHDVLPDDCECGKEWCDVPRADDSTAIALSRNSLPAILEFVKRAVPILATDAEGECIFEGLHGVTCDPPWTEGPDGKAPDGGPACEPCRARALLAEYRGDGEQEAGDPAP